MARPRSDEARRRALEATRDLIVENGVTSLTIEDVAARSGVAKTTIYRHWPERASLIVDAVNDIVTIPPEAMQPLPDMGEATAAHYLEGLATIEQRLILILALDRLSDSVSLTAEAA